MNPRRKLKDTVQRDCTQPFSRRRCGVTSVLRSKTLAQAGFTPAEHVKISSVPKRKTQPKELCLESGHFKGAHERRRAARSRASIRSAAENCHRRNSFPPLNDKIGRRRANTPKPKTKAPASQVLLFWWRLMGSNHRPLACEASALTS